MSDPIKDLEEFPTVPTTPLPAQEVRRRGDRLRRRRQALGAAASVAAVLLIAVTGAFLVDGSRDADPGPSGKPEPTLRAETILGPVTPDQLLTTREALFGELRWEEVDTFPGDGHGTGTACQAGTFDGLGAVTLHQRLWTLEGTHHLQHAVVSFASPEAAQAAFETWAEWLTDCTRPGVVDYTAAAVDAPALQVDQQLVVDSTWTDPRVEEGGESYADRRSITGLVRIGDRLSVLMQTSPAATDDAYGWERSPVVEMLPATAERLELPG